MKKLKYFILLLIILSSCQQTENKERFRIVDANGNPAKINKIVPKFNEEQIMKQKSAFFSRDVNNNDTNMFKNDYTNIQQSLVNKNINAINSSDEYEKIKFNTNKYPDNVFADRITNYNYEEEDNSVEESQNKSENFNKIITEEKKIKQDNRKIETKKEKIQDKTTEKNFYIQIGIFSEEKNAKSSYNKYKNINNGEIITYKLNNKPKYKVVLGPYSQKNLAEKDLNKIIKTGHYDVYITEKK
jgi:cell division protein FtsN